MRSILCPVMLGRRDEAAVLGEALEAAVHGRGRVVAVLGDAGVGKSRLVREFLAGARSRRTVMTGRATVGVGATALRPFAEALQSAFRERRPHESAELRPFRAVLSRVIPDWREGDAVPQSDPIVVAEGVLRLLRAMTGGSAAVLALEDLHWADLETLAVLEYLCDHLTGEPIVCVVTCRQDESSPGAAALRSLLDRRAADALPLPPLRDVDVLEMVRACLGCEILPAGMGELVARAEGVPFLVEELLASAVAVGALAPRGGRWVLAPSWRHVLPAGLADGVRRRMTSLGERGPAVLRAAAVLGRSFDWTLVGPVTGLSGDVVLDLLRRSVDAQLLTQVHDTAGRSFRFRHTLTHDAVLADLTEHEISTLAARGLAALEAGHPGLPGDTCALAAQLAETAGYDVRAVELLREGASRALAEGALSRAETQLDRARRIGCSEPELMVSVDEMLIEVLALSGKTDDVAGVAERLLGALHQISASRVRRASVHLALAGANAAASRWAAARGNAEKARRLVGQGSGQLSAAIDAVAAEVAMGEFRLDEAHRRARSALHGAQRLVLPDVECHALEILGRHARTRDLAAAEALFTRAVETAERDGLVVRRLRALHELGTVTMLRAHDLAHLEQAEQLAVDAGALATAAVVNLQLAAVHVYDLRAEQVLTHARRSADLAAQLGLRMTQAAATAQLATAHALAGRRETMEQAVTRALELMPDHPDIAGLVWGNARALMSLLDDDRPAAVEALDRAMPYLRDPRCTVPGGVIQPLWALLHTLGAGSEDGRLARDEVRASRAVAVPVGRAFLGYADAVALGRTGDRDAAETAFAAAADLTAPYQRLAVRLLALRLVAEAAVEDGWGEPAAWLREALDRFDGSRHSALSAGCRRLLVRTGAKVPRRRGSSTVPPLLRARGVTGREVDVLALLVQGLTNRQIAARLTISTKTVEKHIEHLMDKTGLARRTELARTAAIAGIGSHRPA